MRLPAALRAMAALYWTTVIRSRRSLIIGVLAAAALVVFLVTTATAGPADGTLLLAVFLYSGPLGFLVQFASLFYGAAVVTEEVENGTAALLFVRPVPRPAFLAARAGVAFLFTAGLLAALTLIVGVAVPGRPPAGDLAAALAAVVVSALCYVSVFTLLGVLFGNPVTIGLLFLFLWDLPVSATPFAARLLTLKFHALSLARGLLLPTPHQTSWAGGLFKALDEPPGTAAVVLGVITVVSLAASVRLFMRKELVGR